MATGKKLILKPSSSIEKTTNKKPLASFFNSPNLESFACLWLDKDINSTKDNLVTQEELRQVINHLQTFEDSDQCEQYIRQITHEKIILIVSGSLGRQLVAQLHPLSQFSACYVFCQDKKGNEQWASKYHKVKGVFIERSELVNAIAQDQNVRAKVEVGASISIISHSSKAQQTHSATFMWFQLFIEVLLRMHHKSSDRKELIDICKENYRGNKQEMKIIRDFDKNYKADNAIWWYTREACFYRMMNKALRVQDYDILFALRFFITDIAKQLKNEHENFIRTSDTREKIRVYRGQAIGADELELMKNSVGEFLSMNTFLSTSRDSSIALDFARLVSTDDSTQPVLFQIEIDPRMKTKAFADVGHMSYYENESEVLIMLGALFRITKMIEDKKNRMWIAYLSLANEDDYDLKETFAYMKEKIGDDTNLDSLGKILLEMGEHQHARKCYERLVEESQLAFGDAQAGLGWTDFQCQEYEKSLEHHRQALKIRKQILGDDDVQVGNSYRQMASAYLRQGNNEEALINLKKSIEILENTMQVDSIILAKTYHNMAVTYGKLEKPDLALEYYNKAVKVQEKSLPPAHPEVARTFFSLGCFHRDNGQVSKALEYYEKSLTISRKTLPPTHQDIIRTESHITKIQKKFKQ